MPQQCETLTVVGCHTNSPEKLICLENNLQFLSEISTRVHVVNSDEFSGSIEALDLNDNVTVSYAPNDKHISHKKIYDYIVSAQTKQYNRFILTNDSYLLTRPILDFKEFYRSNLREMYGICDSRELKYHFPDFLRCYNTSGLNRWIQYYTDNVSRCDSFYDMITVMEIESTSIFKSHRALFTVPRNYHKNIHFDEVFFHKLRAANYPVLKLKKIFGPKYVQKAIPDDFDADVYLQLNTDLQRGEAFSGDAARWHFLNHGIKESRFYKHDQQKVANGYSWHDQIHENCTQQVKELFTHESNL